jgi:hypothetical protein
MRRGSASWALKASRAARSVSLPLVGLGEEYETDESRISRKMTGMRGDMVVVAVGEDIELFTSLVWVHS